MFHVVHVAWQVVVLVAVVEHVPVPYSEYMPDQELPIVDDIVDYTIQYLDVDSY